MRILVLFFLALLALPLNAQRGNIDIKLQAPENAVAGSDFEVVLTFNKGNLKDYSRFSQDLPEGFTAANINSPNADFTFSEQRVRIIWLKLPEDEEIKVSYSIRPHDRISGKLELGGTFAYVDDGERAYLNIAENTMVNILPNPNIDAKLVVDISEFPAIMESKNTAAESREFASVVRQKPQVEQNGIVYVSLLVKKPEGTNFLKLEESIPGGYSFEAIDAAGAVVSQAASVAKFVWMRPPADEVFSVKYRLVPVLERDQEALNITGTLTFTDNGETKTNEVVEADVNVLAMSKPQQLEYLQSGTIPADLPKAEMTQRGSENTEVVRTQPAAKEAVSARTNQATRQPSHSGRSTVLNIPALQLGSGNVFRVQVAAVRNPYFAKVYFADFDLLRDVKLEVIDGWYKYTVGPFNSYDEATAYKKRIMNETPVENAFVVAYRSGARVQVNEIR